MTDNQKAGWLIIVMLVVILFTSLNYMVNLVHEGQADIQRRMNE